MHAPAPGAKTLRAPRARGHPLRSLGARPRLLRLPRVFFRVKKFGLRVKGRVEVEVESLGFGGQPLCGPRLDKGASPPTAP